MLLVRTDATKAIGAGHVMRCAAIAQEARARAMDVLFLVSTEESAKIVADQGFESLLVGGDPSLFLRVDAMNVARVVKETGGCALIIDSYAVTNGFFAQLRETLTPEAVKVAYVDDAFTFKEGFSETPAPIEADVVINYGFDFTPDQYEEIYADLGTRLCIGPSYTPVRRPFSAITYETGETVENILITCGMANPRSIQEKLVRACKEACPTAHIDVIVGGNAPFDAGEFSNLEVHRQVKDLVPFMQKADVALSASGLTLYELTAAGIPTIAIPTASNQMGHALGFQNLNLGPSIPIQPLDLPVLCERLFDLCESPALRKAYSKRMKQTVDGFGASRILDEIAG